MNRKSFFKALGFGAVGVAAAKVLPAAAKPAQNPHWNAPARGISEEAMQWAFDACEAEPCATCGGFGVVVTEHDTGGSVIIPSEYSDGRFLSSARAVTWVSEPCPDCGGPKIHWTSAQERSHWEESDWGELE